MTKAVRNDHISSLAKKAEGGGGSCRKEQSNTEVKEFENQLIDNFYTFQQDVDFNVLRYH